MGANFTPSTAINQLEMWQERSFDLETIDRELGWAAAFGMNAMRVYLHDLLWVDDAMGLIARMERYLAVADRHDIRTLFVLFDDCHGPRPRLGQQPAPRPGCHNPGWVQGPGADIVDRPTDWPRLRDYTLGVIDAFKSDRRVLGWDLYNEPGNSGYELRTLPLLDAVFDWAQSIRPDQPLTSAIWTGPDPTGAQHASDEPFARLNACVLSRSDVISFHNYDGVDEVSATIASLRKLGRPLYCTEYLARNRGSRIQTHVPLFRQTGVGCFNWGLVWGKTGTVFPWGSPDGSPEPEVWFHDLLRADGTPFDAAEIAVIRDATRR